MNERSATEGEMPNPERGDADSVALDRAVKTLAAMAHAGRLELIRLLVQAGPEGLMAGALARAAGIGPTTASAQLLVLANAGLVRSQRRGRQMNYQVSYEALEGVMGFVLEDCCGGQPALCEPLAERLARCCAAPCGAGREVQNESRGDRR